MLYLIGCFFVAIFAVVAWLFAMAVLAALFMGAVIVMVVAWIIERCGWATWTTPSGDSES